MRGGDGVSEKFDKVRYDNQYRKEHYDAVRILLSKDKQIKDRVKAAAERAGLSVNQWVVKAIEKELEWYE